MMEHFPFGTGFGSFGSSIAANYYSPIYERLGYQNNYGMSSEYSGFLTDCFWPTIFAQFGFIGLVFLFLIICYFLLISIRKLKINRDAGFAMLMTIVYLLITSVAESSFFNPTAFLFFILFQFPAQQIIFYLLPVLFCIAKIRCIPALWQCHLPESFLAE